MKYHRILSNQGCLLDGYDGSPRRGTAHMDGVLGVTDPRFLSEYGTYRRITGKIAEAIIAAAEKSAPKSVYCGGFGQRPDYNLYDVPLSVIVEFDPQTDVLEVTA